jgi:hypothetical protein
MVAPFIFLGIPSGHDLEFHLNSWVEVVSHWKQGVLYPHWAAMAHYGYGEARFLFYPPASWLLGAVIGLFLPWKLAAGVYVWIVLTFCGLSMFLLAKEWLPAREAIFAAIFYIANPYFIVVVYWRSAFAELLAGVFIPLLALIILRFPEKKWRAAILPLTLVIAATWLTNVPAAVMVNYSVALLVFAVVVFRRSLRTLFYGAAGVVLGTLLAGFYLLPAFYEQKWINVGEALSEGYRPQDNFLFVTTSDISHTQFNHFISIVAAGEIIALCVVICFAFRRAQSRSWTFGTLAIWGGALSLSMLSITGVFWKHIPELRFMQFPWRWLLCLNVPLAIFAALASKRWLVRIGFYLLLLIAIFYVSNKSVPPWWDHAPDIADMLDNQNNGTGYDGADEYLPANADIIKVNLDAPKVVYQGNGSAQITVTTWDAEKKIFTVVASAPGKVALRLFDYPAWKVTVNNHAIQSETDSSNGQMIVAVSKGISQMEVRFSNTADRTVGKIISLLTLLLMGIFTIWRNPRKAL